MADLNDLRKDWDEQPTYSEEKMNEIASLVESRSSSLRETLFKRDMGETAAAVFIVAVFAPALFVTSGLLAKAGIWIAILGAVEIVGLLYWVRSRDRADFAALPLKDFLASELRSLDRQIALLRYVAWWYILPLYTGACLFVVGIELASADRPFSPTDFVFSTLFCIGYFVFCAMIWWINQHARKTQLQPLRDVMQRTYDSVTALESPENEADLIASLADPELDLCKRKTSKAVIWSLLALFLTIGVVGMGLAAWYDVHSKRDRAPIQQVSEANTPAAESTDFLDELTESLETNPNASSDTSHFSTATSVDALVSPLVEAGDLKGVSVGIVNLDSDGSLQSKTHHYGLVAFRDDNENPPRTPDDQTLYEVGGLTKIFTGVLLAAAVERGEVTLESPVSLFVPPDVRIPSYEDREISFLNMITDQTGLPRLPSNLSVFANPTDPYRDYTSEKAEEFLREYELEYAPGTKYVYSNFTAAYLGHVLTKIAGVNNYDTLLRERLTKPLGLQHTKVVLENEDTQLPIGHSRTGNERTAWHCADLPGAGGVRSSIGDMNRIMAACIQPIESEVGKAMELAFEKHVESAEVTMGLGWPIIPNDTTRWSNGATGGFHATIFVNREQGFGVCVLGNSSNDVIFEIAKQIFVSKIGATQDQEAR